jgi:protein-L-isoaspartate O-methyltransferase
MNTIAKLIRADESRKTRFHTSNGYLCLDPGEFLRAFGTTIARLSLKKYSHCPWLVYSATSHLAPLVAGRRVFEFGSGMSTVWFSERCREVVSVESNSEWYSSVVNRTKRHDNVRVVYADSKPGYLGAISEAGGKFDVILIDGLYRKDCVQLARTYLNRNGMVIVDNTDIHPDLAETVKSSFGDSKILSFQGWVPGCLHASETTVIQGIPI